MKLKLLIFFLLAVTCSIGYYFYTTMPKHSDILLFNGRVYTLDPANSVYEAVAVRENLIAAVGSSDELKKRFEGGQRIDLEGHAVMPGFIDAHAHMGGLGKLLESVILLGIRSPGEVAGLVRERAAKLKGGEWLYGRGWDQNLWQGKQFPTAAMLDSAVSSNPVVLVRIDGHAIWVNSKAMEIAGISRDTKDPQGGKIIRYSDGRPSGVFVDNARDLVENVVPPPVEADIERRILAATQECVKAGLTEVGDMGLDSLDIAVYRRLAEEKKLPVRIYGAISAPGPLWKGWAAREPIVDYADGMFSLRAMKMYTDGALGSRGAALVEEYSDDPGNRGLTMISDSELESNIRLAFQKGYQVCIHAIGDRANHITLNAYEKVMGSAGKGDYRARIEHAQVILPEDIPRFKKLGILPSMQPVHAVSDMPWAESRLGPKRIKEAYAWKSLISSGSIIPGGSDCPNDILSPIWGFYAAVTRTDALGNPAGGWYPQEKMTRLEAARCFTQWAAYASFHENLKGTLAAGKWADLTVLSKDIMQLSEREILSAEVELTMVGGKIVYEKHSETALR